ncbi:MAG: BrnA antitoxin family protein [Treponema sp.]|jgi:uncharacterized protein (DUF4415 family)|nr:BrnA antitoxin family protein [Treponema sp.]
MAIIKSTVPVGAKPPKDVIKRIKKAAKYPITFTEDCPESTPESLKEFAQLAAERNRRKKKRSVTIRIAPDVLENYKTMGSGYTGIMADVLKYAVDNPNVLTAAISS